MKVLCMEDELALMELFRGPGVFEPYCEIYNSEPADIRQRLFTDLAEFVLPHDPASREAAARLFLSNRRTR